MARGSALPRLGAPRGPSSRPRHRDRHGARGALPPESIARRVRPRLRQRERGCGGGGGAWGGGRPRPGQVRARGALLPPAAPGRLRFGAARLGWAPAERGARSARDRVCA